MKKIALLYMGGTFGCVGAPLSPMPETEFLPHLKKLLPLNPQIDCFSAPSVKDSSAYTAVDWFLLIQQIQDLQTQHYQHFIVIHGTDTLSYAAATLARFLAQSCQVILTGSQYPLLNTTGQGIREVTDALDNLNTAIEHIEKVSAGVYVAFHHQVFHASTTLKVHSTALDAFAGTSYHEQIRTSELPPFQIQKQHIDQIASLNILNLSLQPIAQLQLNRQLEGILKHAPDVLIIQAYGTGNVAVNDTMIAQFKLLQQQGCRVILASQVAMGGLDQRYAISQWIKQSNVLVSNAQSHADLYAKILKMYLQYPSANQWHEHWYKY